VLTAVGVSGSTQALALAWSLGWRIAAGLLIGYYADEWLGTSPWLTLLLSMAALVAGVRAMLAVLNDGHTERTGAERPPR
jgi:F0F1-type ATP synthase assembly protein I